MEPEEQTHLDAQVAEVMRELQAAGEQATIDRMARKVGKRTADVLHAIKRLTAGSPAEPDTDTPPEAYPAVVASQARVNCLTAARAEAEQELTEADAALTRAELAAADAVAEGRDVPSLVEARQRAVEAAEQERLFGLALQVAKTRHGDVLTAAQAQHWAAQWRVYQEAVQAFDAALGDAYAAQERARERWVAIGQPGEAPMLKTALANWDPYFHAFLQQILDTAPEAVRQPSPRHHLLWWGMNSTVFRKYPLDPHPELHGP